MFLYSIFDKKAVDFGPLFTSQNDGTAMRVVSVNITNDILLHSSPGDFSLYCLGEYDTNTGNVSGFSPIKLVCEVLALIQAPKDKES